MTLVAPPRSWTAADVRALRDRLGWTQAQLADALGYDNPRTISEIEGDRRNPSGSARVLLDILDVHGCLPTNKPRG